MLHPDILAAGAVLWRHGEHEPELALVHRPRYDDWSFPKGKRKRREHLLATVQREVFEETGLRPVLGRPLAPSFYDKDGRRKRVDYWCATVAGGAAGPATSREVDAVAWAPLSEAAERLTHERDRLVLADFTRHADRVTVPFILVRHAAALSEADWFDHGELRTLNRRGRERAAQLAGLLAGYPIERAYSATSARCLETLLPYCAAAAVPLTGLPELTPGVGAAAQAGSGFDRIVAEGRGAVVCGGKESVEAMIEHCLGAPVPGEEPLEQGSFRVLHTVGGRIVATERHD